MILLAEYGCLLPWLRPLQSQGARTPANSHVPSGPARIVMLPQLQSALKEGAPRLDFLGKAVALDRNTGIFVTLNPAGKGYGGRSRLPDNLKQLFRRAWQGVTAATLRRAWRPESLYHGLTRRPTLCLPSVDNFWALDCTASFSDWQSLPGAAWLYTCAHMLPNACTNTPPQSRVSPSSETCRPIAMTVPDHELIAEVLLASEGFTAAAAVSQSFTVTAVAPAAPTIGAATAGDAQASVSFTAPQSDGGAGVSAYTVTASPGGMSATGSAAPILVAGLSNGTEYRFSVTATNAAGTGPASELSEAVTPAASQTISFANPGTQSFTATPTLVATATSGLAVSFSALTEGCTITPDGALSFAATGTCTIRAGTR